MREGFVVLLSIISIKSGVVYEYCRFSQRTYQGLQFLPRKEAKMKKYQHAYIQFLAEIQKLDDITDAKFEQSSQIENALTLSGQIIGEDTLEKIILIGQKHGFHVFASELSVLYRQ